MRRDILTPSLIAAALALVTRAAAAQDDRYDYRDDGWMPRSFVGGEGTYARPQGEFSSYVRNGWGGGVHYLVRLDRDGWLGVRADASMLNYGH